MIKKLPKEVINKIAAGEVIQRPYNVIKQLVENAIDAEASHIIVNIINGGLTSIEITDNGKGIKREDFPLLCQRFATSKISQLCDLENIQSFGFRGEALASLSYVSQLQITSKHKEESIGYRCCFKNQKMTDQPQKLSTNTGTKIKAGELFGNLQTRRSSLNPNQQKKRIIKLLSHFALHYNQIKFSLISEKGSEISTDFRSMKVSESKMKAFQFITKLPYDKFTYLPKEILQQIKIQTIITKLNTIKSKTLLLNINNRIVENPQIMKSIQRAYSQCYQSIHQQNQTFFVYLSIDIDPKKIDCNQHPSKKIIGFFGAEKIYENIYLWTLQHIKEESSIKNIATNIVSKGKMPFNINKNMVFNIKNQTLKLNNNEQNTNRMEFTQQNQNKSGNVLARAEISQVNQSKGQLKESKPIYGFQKVRTDSLQMPINYYFKNNSQGMNSNKKQLKYNLKVNEKDQNLPQNTKKFFQCASYVGCFNLNYIFIQIEDRLYLMNVLPCLQSFVRQWLPQNMLLIQEIVSDFEQLDLQQIITSFLRNKNLEGKINVDQLIDTILINKYLLAKEYGIGVEQSSDGKNGTVIFFPIFDKSMSDCLIADELAYFLCRMFSKQPNEAERESYFIQLLISLFQEDNNRRQEQVKVEQESWRRELSPMNDRYSDFFRDKVIPVLKTKGKDYSSINFSDYLSELVNIKQIYKIFERC